MTVREVFRGDARDTQIVVPIDPSRPHRFREGDVGHARACAICAGWRRDSVHADDAKQMTVKER